MTQDALNKVNDSLSEKLHALEDIRIGIQGKIKRNKILFAVFIFLAYLYSALEMHAMLQKSEKLLIAHGELIAELLADVSLLVAALIVFFTIKPYEFLDRKKSKELRNQYKYQIIKTVVREFNPYFQYFSIHKTNKQVVLQSELFGKNFDDHREEDKIYGIVNGAEFVFSELRLRKGLFKVFSGLFGIITLSHQHFLHENMRNHIVAAVDSFKAKSGIDIKFNYKNNKLYFAIPIDSNLFEFDISKSLLSNPVMDHEIGIIYDTLSFVEDATCLTAFPENQVENYIKHNH